MHRENLNDPEWVNACISATTALNADLYSLEEIESHWAEQIAACIASVQSKREHAVVMLTRCDGGEQSTAYEIALNFLREYKRLSVYIPAACSGAGMTLAYSAHAVIISRDATLESVDVRRSRYEAPHPALEEVGRLSGIEGKWARQMGSQFLSDAA